MLHVGEPLEVARVQADDESVRHQGAVGRGQPFGFHRPLDPTLQLHGLHPGAEQTSRRALEEAFEEPLDGGQRRHGWWRSLAEARRSAPRRAAGTIAARPGTPVGGTAGTPGYTLRCVRVVSTQAFSTRTGSLMPETLTESFCERCGSRYTFESAAPKQRLRGARVLSRGFKNFVLDDKTSFDEAMAAARMDTDRESTNAQLDAFHKTFNFCMDCRQYTCPNCWNEAEGRCLGCAPMVVDVGPAAAITASPFHTQVAPPLSAPTNGTAATNGAGTSNGTGAAYGAAANGHALVEPDAEFDPLARLAFLTAAAPAADPEPAVEPEAVAEVAADPEPDVAAVEPELVAEVAVEADVVAEVAPVEPENVADVTPVADAVPAEAAVEADTIEAEPDVDAAASAAIAAALIEPEWILRAQPVEDVPAEPVAAESEPEAAVAEAEALVAEPVAEAMVEEPVALATEPVAEPEVEGAAAAEPDTVAASPTPRIEIEPEPMLRPQVTADPSDPTSEVAAAAAVRTSVMFTSMRPGQTIDEAIAEFDESERSRRPSSRPSRSRRPSLRPSRSRRPSSRPRSSPLSPSRSPRSSPPSPSRRWSLSSRSMRWSWPNPSRSSPPSPSPRRSPPSPSRSPEPEPVVAAEPRPAEPAPVVAAEPEPEPVVAEPEPVVAVRAGARRRRGARAGTDRGPAGARGCGAARHRRAGHRRRRRASRRDGAAHLVRHGPRSRSGRRHPRVAQPADDPRSALPRPAGRPDGRGRRPVGRLEPAGRCTVSREPRAQRRRAGLRQLRPVTLRHRPVLPAVRERPAPLTRRSSRPARADPLPGS